MWGGPSAFFQHAIIKHDNTLQVVELSFEILSRIDLVDKSDAMLSISFPF